MENHSWTSVYIQAGSLFVGDTVIAPTKQEAQEILNSTGRGHMKIDGKLVFEISADEQESDILGSIEHYIESWSKSMRDRYKSKHIKK